MYDTPTNQLYSAKLICGSLARRADRIPSHESNELPRRVSPVKHIKESESSRHPAYSNREDSPHDINRVPYGESFAGTKLKNQNQSLPL